MANKRKYKHNTYDMKLTASKLQENVYRILDQVLQSGTPVVVERKGRTLKIVSGEAPKKTFRLIRRNIIRGSAENLVHMDWTKEWKPE